MCRTLLPKIPIFLLIFCVLQLAAVVGQAKPAAGLSISKCWEYALINGGAVASDTTRIYLGSEGAKVEALSPDGKKMWSSELGGEITSNLLPADSGLLLVTSSPGSKPAKIAGNLRSLSVETGITTWTLRLPDAERHFLGSHNGSAIIVSQSGSMQAVDTKSGGVKWKREIADGFVAAPVFANGKVIVAARGNQIFTISLASGEISSMRKSVHVVTALGEMASGEIVVGDERGNISTLNGSDKPQWKFKSGGEISRIFVIGGNILAASHDNFVYYLLGRNGDVEWKKRLVGRILHIGNIADRFALTMSLEDKTAMFTDLENGKIAGQVVFTEGEMLVSPPVASNGSIFLLTNRSVYLYSINGCGQI